MKALSIHAYPDQATSSAAVKAANAAAVTIEVIMIAEVIGELPLQGKKRKRRRSTTHLWRPFRLLKDTGY